ncbi:MAG: hypothetical protein CMJ81_19020 [Planctomycetaceae bacterium]|nr:hypothetical protein [Planctomycetaceae bacterium]MBP62668.1 hypothetical protein [Planctomycetaceae bacterium]
MTVDSLVDDGLNNPFSVASTLDCTSVLCEVLSNNPPNRTNSTTHEGLNRTPVIWFKPVFETNNISTVEKLLLLLTIANSPTFPYNRRNPILKTAFRIQTARMDQCFFASTHKNFVAICRETLTSEKPLKVDNLFYGRVD